ncbi:MAG TPA: YeeE/YedE thiosulfate transporter family protein [Gemmatimonadaceae bacterium]|nr:YeeE/YedE thiosulfate transporter family protein [Gemmatimonadaceae bacterium]
MALESLPVAATAIPIGVAFGVVLERAGLGDPRVIAGQLTGHDFTVVRVMFGAIVTAMLGLAWGSAAGWIDPARIAIPPTDIGAQALGAVLFGGGFALAALCPGTACVAASSGRRDGLAAVAGMFMGTALTPAVWPAVGGVAAPVPREGARLPDDLGIPLGAVVLLVTVAGVVAAMIARRRESIPAAVPRWWRPRTVEAVALTLAVAFALTDAQPSVSPERLAAIAGEIRREADHVHALELAEWIREGRDGLRVIDVRDGVEAGTYRIPGARIVPLDSIPLLPVARGEDIVLYSDGGAHAAQAWVLLRARGVATARVLEDGLAGWEDEVLSPVPPTTPDDSAQTRFRRARALALWFGGRPRLMPVADTPAPARVAPRPRRRNTC